MISQTARQPCVTRPPLFTPLRVLEVLITTNCKSDINHDYVAQSGSVRPLTSRGNNDRVSQAMTVVEQYCTVR